MKLIYIDELVNEILKAIRTITADSELYIQPGKEIFVSDVLSKLIEYKTAYLENGIFPDTADVFFRETFLILSEAILIYKITFLFYLKRIQMKEVRL